MKLKEIQGAVNSGKNVYWEGHGWLVVSGDPLKGLVFYGLFPTNEAACDWAQTALTGGEDWWVAPLLCTEEED